MKSLTEKQLIKQWAEQAKRFFYLTEGTTTFFAPFEDFKRCYGKYVADNNYTYFIAIDTSSGDADGIDDYYLFLTSDNVDELINSKIFDEYAIDYVNEYITDDGDLCRHFGITYHDDSDYDREYGYGPAGDYDENEILEKSEELYDKAFVDLRDDVEKQLKAIAKDPSTADDYRIELKNNVFTFVIGMGEIEYTKYAVMFGITNYKQQVGKLLSRGKVVRIR